jgi:hypothetical protein
MTDDSSQRAKRIHRDELALIAAGHTRRRAHLLATLNWWVLPITLLVAVATLVWVGIHLWPDLDVPRWQAWADENPGFFAPLDTGAKLAIIPELHSHAGLLLTKSEDGMTVERHLWFPFHEVPVGLVVDPAAADRFLDLEYGDEDFWSQWNTLAREQRISVYEHLSDGVGAVAGYRAFLARLRKSRSR